MNKNGKNNIGFSLVELIIVIAIMAILAAAIAPALVRYINKSRIADDVNTASTIAKAVELALGEEKPWDDFLDIRNAAGDSSVSCNVDGSADTYDVRIIATCTSASNYAFSSGISGRSYLDEVFCNAINSNLGINAQGDSETNRSKLPFKYKKVPDGGTVKADHWIICSREDNSEVEVWIAGPGSDDPIYRITPSICDEYNQ